MNTQQITERRQLNAARAYLSQGSRYLDHSRVRNELAATCLDTTKQAMRTILAYRLAKAHAANGKQLA